MEARCGVGCRRVMTACWLLLCAHTSGAHSFLDFGYQIG